jgi:endonuclease YncB( thermonuclease family)
MKRIVLGVLFVTVSAWMSACNEGTSPDEGPTVVVSATVDSVAFWPPTLRYARTGDSVSLRLMGLKKGYACATFVTDLGWTYISDTNYTYRLRIPLVQQPETPTCAVDPGKDSLFKRAFFTDTVFAPAVAGKKLYLQIPGLPNMDSLTYVTGTAELHSFIHLSSTVSRQSVHGRFTFLDSTAASPRRRVRLASPAACEILQTAVFDRRGDTLAVRVRRLQANPLPAAVVPDCAGPRAADSIEVVFNAHRFP